MNEKLFTALELAIPNSNNDLCQKPDDNSIAAFLKLSKYCAQSPLLEMAVEEAVSKCLKTYDGFFQAVEDSKNKQHAYLQSWEKEINSFKKEMEALKKENALLKETHIKRFVKLATRTESPAGPVLERIKNNPEAFELFVGDMRNIIKSLQLLDKWKKNLYYGKVSAGLKTKKNLWDKFLGLFKKKEKLVEFDEKMIRILHGSVGICTEGGELLEALDKHLKGKQLDNTNCIEELCDTQWYCHLLYDVFETDAEKNCQLFVDKLKKRFPDKFTEDKAINRDLVTERKLLEDNTKKA
jgi:hypothetical protein